MTDIDLRDLNLGEYPGTNTILALERKPAEPEPEPTCANCRLWDIYPKYPQEGVCNLPHKHDSPISLTMGYCEEAVHLETPAWWHCKGWQPRQPSPDAP
jgi:hypothetical protein